LKVGEAQQVRNQKATGGTDECPASRSEDQ
jgi:hypothetical protein